MISIEKFLQQWEAAGVVSQTEEQSESRMFCYGWCYFVSHEQRLMQYGQSICSRPKKTTWSPLFFLTAVTNHRVLKSRHILAIDIKKWHPHQLVVKPE